MGILYADHGFQINGFSFRVAHMNFSMKKLAILLPNFYQYKEKVECYEEVANHSQSIFTSTQNVMFDFFYIFDMTHWKIEKVLCWIKVNIRWEWLVISIGRPPSSKFLIFSSEFPYRPILGAHSEMSNHLI